MIFKRIFCVLTVFVLCITPLFSVSAAENDNVSYKNVPSSVTDGKISTRAAISEDTEITVNSKNPLKYLYIIFWDNPVNFTITSPISESSIFSETEFLHCLVELPENFEYGFTLNFQNAANISEIAVYTEENKPADIQKWENNNTPCDLLLFSTHADDEQLFFSGVLPLYATNENCEVQVVYFTDHSDNIIRRHELLNGLWTVGVTRYPVISPFPDAYSESYSGAVSNLKRAGYSEDDALAFQVEQIRRFKPLVILGHDLNGEYGHGQHILNANLLTKAVLSAADETQFAASSELYGVYDTPKLYLHLYSENQITLDLDTVIEHLGKTPFQLSQDGYACHNTQQGYWFTDWIHGKNNEITKASQIKKYSPCNFGLYRTTVGEDINKNDLFENLTMRSLIPAPQPEPEPEPIIIEPEAPATSQSNRHLTRFLILPLAAAVLIILFLILKNKIKAR